MGMGDEVMATAHARKLHMETGRRVVIVDMYRKPRWSEVWENNPIISRTHDGQCAELINGPGARPYLQGWDAAARTWRFNPAYRADAFRGEIHLTAHETERAAQLAQPDEVLIEPNVNPRNSVNKQWGAERWQALVDSLPHLRWVMMDWGGPIKLQGVRVITVPRYRDACAVVQRTALLVAVEGGLHHAAAALNKPAVVIFGGFVSPLTTGYSRHSNLAGTDEACGKFDACEHCRQAMDRISVGAVRASVLARLPPALKLSAVSL